MLIFSPLWRAPATNCGTLQMQPISSTAVSKPSAYVTATPECAGLDHRLICEWESLPKASITLFRPEHILKWSTMVMSES